jgi:UDP-N-acetylglucosamine 4,6-dehydratase
MMERNPSEAVQTNVNGADNVIRAAIDAGVRKVLALSTDKACAPTNLYGATKLVAEKLFLAASEFYTGVDGPRFSVVRYGNIAGSRGSVIPKWRSLPPGYPVPVTDPDSTRFWMTLDESVDLVLFALKKMQGGDTVIPQMPTFRVGDLAAAMGRKMSIMGMRPGEKMHETIITEHEAHSFTRSDSAIGSLPGFYVSQRGKEGRPVISSFTKVRGLVEGPIRSSDGEPMSVEQIQERLKEV